MGSMKISRWMCGEEEESDLTLGMGMKINRLELYNGIKSHLGIGCDAK